MSSLYNCLQFITISSESLKSNTIPPLKDKLFLFDIDDTLYKSTPNLYNAEIESWMKVFNSLIMDYDNPPSFRELITRSPMQGAGFYQFFNKTAKEAEVLRGPFPYNKFLNKDLKLKEVLLNLPYRKFCFTNGTKGRAESLLQALGLEDCFEGVICVDDNEKGTNGKPFEFSYTFVESLFDIKNTGDIYFFDDNTFNIEAAKKRGWNVFQVSKDKDISEMISNVKSSLINN